MYVDRARGNTVWLSMHIAKVIGGARRLGVRKNNRYIKQKANNAENASEGGTPAQARARTMTRMRCSADDDEERHKTRRDGIAI